MSAHTSNISYTAGAAVLLPMSNLDIAIEPADSGTDLTLSQNEDNSVCVETISKNNYKQVGQHLPKS